MATKLIRDCSTGNEKKNTCTTKHICLIVIPILYAIIITRYIIGKNLGFETQPPGPDRPDIFIIGVM